MPLHGDTGFAIAPSQAGLERYTFVSPDVATCADCPHELCEPANPRYRYALRSRWEHSGSISMICPGIARHMLYSLRE